MSPAEATEEPKQTYVLYPLMMKPLMTKPPLPKPPLPKPPRPAASADRSMPAPKPVDWPNTT